MIDICKLEALNKVKELLEEIKKRPDSEKDTTDAGILNRVRKFFRNDDDFKDFEIPITIRSIPYYGTRFQVMVPGKSEQYIIGYWDDYEEKMYFCMPEQADRLK